MFNLGYTIEVFGRTTPAFEWKFSGVEQAWMAAGLGVLVNVAGAMDQNGGDYPAQNGSVYQEPTVIKNGIIGHREETRE